MTDLKKYLEIVMENDQGLIDINSIAKDLKFLPTNKQDLTYKPWSEVNGNNVNKMPPMHYAVASEPFVLATVTSRGEETVQNIEAGMVILSGPSGEKYFNKPAKFKSNYPVNKGNGAVGPDLSEVRMVAQYPAGAPKGQYPASYGGTTAVEPGDWLVIDKTAKDPNYPYYTVAQFEFSKTYNNPRTR